MFDNLSEDVKRYVLRVRLPSAYNDFHCWYIGHLSTKKEIEEWIQENIEEFGLDWRVGYTVKFLDNNNIYEWVNYKTKEVVKP